MAAQIAPSSPVARCLIISANTVETPYPVYPLGVAHIIGSLHDHGHLVDHFDYLALGGLDRLRQTLHEKRYDIIGISIRNIDNVDSSAPQKLLGGVLEIMRIVREKSAAKVILGGPGFSIMPEVLLNYLGGDYGVVGEGEVALPLLVATLINGKEPATRLVSHSLKNFPESLPCYSDEVAPFYISQGGMLNIQTKRGCSYGCSYCSYPTIEGRVIRHRDPGAVADEVQRLVRDHGAKYIFFTDSVFNDPAGRYLEIAQALIRAENTTPWCGFFRPQNISREDLKLLKQSGMAALELGTDAASDTTLNALNKGFSFDEVVSISTLCAEEEIPCAHFIMFGGPGETRQSLEEGIMNLRRLKDCVIFAYIGIRVFPDTRVYTQALAEGLISPSNDMIEPFFYYSQHVDRDEIDKLLRQEFMGRRDRIYPISEKETHIRMLHSLGHKGPLWDLLLSKRVRK